jgi:hypothetical protein
MPAPLVTISTDGDSTAVVANAVATNTLIKAGAGTLGRILVTTANGAAAALIYDAAAPATGSVTGTIIGVVPASAAVGTVVSLGMPFTLGCLVAGAATNGAFTISYH